MISMIDPDLLLNYISSAGNYQHANPSLLAPPPPLVVFTVGCAPSTLPQCPHNNSPQNCLQLLLCNYMYLIGINSSLFAMMQYSLSFFFFSSSIIGHEIFHSSSHPSFMFGFYILK